jgi:quercetin dioxygenase-like cupin family protein
MKRRRHFLVTAAAAVALVSLGAFVAVTKASPPSGVTPTLLARGTYDAFRAKSDPKGPVGFKAKAKAPLDFVVRKHDYNPGSTTGWHTHAGPVFVTVTQGTLTFYEYGDRKCTPHVVSAGEGYVDHGRGHIARNETDQPAQDVSVIIAPVAGAFRGELDAPGPFCDF